jgi:hypothetical protein
MAKADPTTKKAIKKANPGSKVRRKSVKPGSGEYSYKTVQSSKIKKASRRNRKPTGKKGVKNKTKRYVVSTPKKATSKTKAVGEKDKKKVTKQVPMFKDGGKVKKKTKTKTRVNEKRTKITRSKTKTSEGTTKTLEKTYHSKRKGTYAMKPTASYTKKIKKSKKGAVKKSHLETWKARDGSKDIWGYKKKRKVRARKIMY